MNIEFTGLSVESARSEEVGSEVDVHIAEEEQHVAPLPRSSPDIQTPTSGELLIQLQESVVFEVDLPAGGVIGNE